MCGVQEGCSAEKQQCLSLLALADALCTWVWFSQWEQKEAKTLYLSELLCQSTDEQTVSHRGLL